MKKVFLLGLTAFLIFSISGAAVAVPRLQTYIVDSQYQNFHSILDQRSWITNSQTFDLKIVGYWDEMTSISDWNRHPGLLTCRVPERDQLQTWLAISVPWKQSGTVYINGVEITGFTNYHNAVPAGTNPSWQLPLTMPSLVGKFSFVKMDKTIDNSQMNAWHYDHGSINSPGWGDEILLKDVVVRGYSWAHFDAIGLDSKGKTHTNPWDHDSSYFATPEPGTLGLLGIGLLGIAPFLRRKKN